MLPLVWGFPFGALDVVAAGLVFGRSQRCAARALVSD